MTAIVMTGVCRHIAGWMGCEISLVCSPSATAPVDSDGQRDLSAVLYFLSKRACLWQRPQIITRCASCTRCTLAHLHNLLNIKYQKQNDASLVCVLEAMPNRFDALTAF
jgi:hypothetical protein